METASCLNWKFVLSAHRKPNERLSLQLRPIGGDYRISEQHARAFKFWKYRGRRVRHAGLGLWSSLPRIIAASSYSGHISNGASRNEPCINSSSPPNAVIHTWIFCTSSPYFGDWIRWLPRIFIPLLHSRAIQRTNEPIPKLPCFERRCSTPRYVAESHLPLRNKQLCCKQLKHYLRIRFPHKEFNSTYGHITGTQGLRAKIWILKQLQSIFFLKRL